MKTFKEYINEMGAGGAGGGGSVGPTNVTGVQSATDPKSATAVDMDKRRRKHNPILMKMAQRKSPKK